MTFSLEIARLSFEDFGRGALGRHRGVRLSLCCQSSGLRTETRVAIWEFLENLLWGPYNKDPTI